jgi:acetoin utilization deacetylase AcuC-like enzyme
MSTTATAPRLWWRHNPAIAYCSLHQFPAYPGTGYDTETGMHHNVLNLPMARGSDSEDYQQRFRDQVLPFLKAFAPDLLIVSAGYDANRADPLASIALEPEDFGKAIIRSVRSKICWLTILIAFDTPL